MSGFDIKALTERNAEIKEELLSIKSNCEAETRSMNDAETEKFDALNEEYTKNKADIATQERFDSIPKEEKANVVVAERSYKAPNRIKALTRADKNKALKAWACKKTDLFDQSYADAAERCGLPWQNDVFKLRLDDKETIQERANTVGTDSQGGYAVNDAVVIGFEKGLKAFWNWADYCTIHRLEGTAPYRILTMNDTASMAGYKAENTATTETALTFGECVLNAYKLTTGVFPVSNETLESAEVDIASIIGQALGERLGRKISYEVTLGAGSGSSAFTGFTTQTTLGKTAADDVTLTEGEVMDLMYSVDPAYRNSPNCKWMMHSLVYLYLMKLEDDNGRKLLGDGINGAPTNMLLGKEVIFNDNLPSALAADAKVIYFGDFSKIEVRIGRDVNIRRSDEKYFLEDAAAFLGSFVGDSKLSNTAAIKHLVMAAA